MVPDVIARLQSEVPRLRSVEPTLSFAAVMASGGLPQNTPAAFVVGATFSCIVRESHSNSVPAGTRNIFPSRAGMSTL